MSQALDFAGSRRLSLPVIFDWQPCYLGGLS
jgi:hypothetical protein